MWNKYKNVIVFMGVSIIGVILYLLGDNELAWKIYNMIGATTTVALAILAFMTYFEYAKGEDKIKIYFTFPKESSDHRKIYTKLYTQRKHFTRGEVLGLLRMIHCNQGNFEVADFNKNPKVLERFQKIQKGKMNELVIEVTEDEIKQFNVL